MSEHSELLLDKEHAKLKGFDSVFDWYLACLNAEINILLDPKLRTDDRLDKLVKQVKTYIEKLSKVPQNYKQENMGLRRLLWLHHGCSVVGLYGDDGEMQCAQSLKHIIDFKRMTVEDLELWLTPEANRELFKAMRDGNFGQEREKDK